MPLGSDRIWEIARAFQASRILLSAVELDVFGALGDEELASRVVAARINADPRGTDRLMNALVALGFLQKQDGLFRNTPETSRFLVPGVEEDLTGALMHTVHLWEAWSDMTASVRAGRATHGERAGARAWTSAFIAAMEHNAVRRATAVVAGVDLSGVENLLDIGGGSGAYAAAFCTAKPGLRATVFDLPQVLSLTRAYVDAKGVGDRVALQSGDYTTDELGSGYDMALLSAIIHSNSPAGNQALFAKCFRALRPGGRLVVQDFIMNRARTEPAAGAVFALNMLVGTAEGDTFTEDEVREWLEGAGFRDVERVDMTGSPTSLLIGTKP